MKALNDYVIFQAIKEENKKSSIILTTEEESKAIWGKVVSAGDMCTDIRAKDIILIPKYADSFMIENKIYYVCHDKDVPALK